ncbi:hypothetical protein GCM10017673_24460 [Streptosporangium violaceochromogenes]|nr:hypothetical protein GCM10017673_24460 [Streptosporangium violaceochromogenes]
MLVAGGVLSPTQAGAEPAEGPVIRSITLNPDSPVVGPAGAVRLVIEVVARGVEDPAGVTIEVEPGVPPGVTARPASPGAGTGQGAGPSAPAYIVTPQGTPAPPAGGPTGGPTGAAAAQATGPRARQGWETWRFLPDKALTRWYPAGRWTVTATARGAGGVTATGRAAFWLRRETRFSAVRVVGKGSEAVRIRGVLNRVDPQGYVDYAPFSERPVDILHRRAGEEDWEKAATVTTDVRGRFVRALPERGSGEWRVRFAQTGHYASRLSPVLR